MGHYRKYWEKLPPSRVSILDQDPRALAMHYSTKTGCWFPMGMRSKSRYERILKMSPSLLSKFKNENILYILHIQPRSIPEYYWDAFVHLAKHKGFSIFHNGQNLTPKIKVRSDRNNWRFERDLVEIDRVAEE